MHNNARGLTTIEVNNQDFIARDNNAHYYLQCKQFWVCQ